MKKIILLIMALLMATAVFGAVVSEQKIDDLGIFTTADTVECEYYQDDNKLYCFGYPSSVQADKFIIWTYDLNSSVIENKTATLPYRPLGAFWGNYYSLWYYDDKMWGLSSYGKAFSYDIATDNTTNLTGINSNLPYFITGHTCCAVDEGTDDVYCIGGTTDGMFKYEMDTDTYTALAEPITDQTRINQADMCDYDQTRDKLYWVSGSYTVNSTEKSGYDVYAYDIAGDTHSLIGTFPNITANPSDPTYDGIRNGYCSYIRNQFYCFTVDDDNYQYDEIFYINVTTGNSGISDVYLHENISFSTCDRINETRTLCYGGYYDQNDWYESDDLFEIINDLPICIEDWSPYYTSCTIGDNQTLLYTDTNACGTYGSLPGDNGTISSCNYCTLQYHFEETGCIDYENTNVPEYDNYGSCCAVTGIAEDCDLPANQSAGSCVGIHESSSLGAIIVDFFVEFGIVILALAVPIVLIGLALWWGGKFPKIFGGK